MSWPCCTILHTGGQCGSAAHGMAAHPGSGLAGWRGHRRCCSARPLSGARSRVGAAARSGDARPGCHARRIAAGDCRNRRAHNDGRTQHDWRRFCGDRRMGTFRNWRRRDAWPRPGCRAFPTCRRSWSPWARQLPPSVRRRSTCISMPAPSGATSLLPSGATTGRLPGSQEMALLP